MRTTRFTLKGMCFTGLLLAGLAGCATPMVQQAAPIRTMARVEASQIITADGEALPLSVWQAPGEPQAIVLALHGFNDYRHAFAGVGPFLAERGITVYGMINAALAARPVEGSGPALSC